MHFSHLNDGSGTKAGKFAMVAGLHVLLGVALVHSLNTRHMSLPKLSETVMVMIQPEIPKPPPPAEPPKPTPKAAPPQVVVPKTEVEVPPPPQDVPQVQATTEPDPTPQPTQVQADAPKAEPSANTGAMRTAVLADADGCAKPDYPAQAARNGETGTFLLTFQGQYTRFVNYAPDAYAEGALR